jgi:pimeloyl-ACP methyl ester carboxylesterase
MGNKIVKVIFAILVLGALTVIFVVWMVWKRPLTIDAWMSRSALKINGLESTKLDTEAGRMTVWEGGSGPTMVLLHGAGDQAGTWARTIGGLVSDYRVVIPDLPGHSKSDPRSGPIHMEQLLDGVARVMDAYAPDEPVVIVGNSMGAWLGFLYAHDHPERVARLVAVNGGPLFNPDTSVNIFPTTRDEARETMKGLMGPASPPIPGFVLDDIVRRTANGPAARFAQTAAEMGAYLLDGKLHEVEVPVELVWGAADQLMTLDYAQRIADGLPRARMHPIKGCGHVPQRECPLRFIEALEEALAAPPVETQDSVILSERSESKNPPKLRATPQEQRSSNPRETLRLTRRTRSLRVTEGGYVIGSESKDPLKFRVKLMRARPRRSCGDPSTHSSDSFAQGDMRRGSRDFRSKRESGTGRAS